MRYSTTDELFEKGKDGDWCFPKSMKYIWILIPKVGPICLPIGKGHKKGKDAWTFTGSQLSPTLHPSINTSDGRNRWHGWMIDGKLKEV